ncbi:MAG: type VI secretion system baseplate subunit TssK, partial [Acidobacteria bacterium]|nr:type VI secretion system baseplate subunit TssK [Acidobacteriota bacterium]
YLGPHHFQAQNRYFEDLIQFATGSLWFSPFGFAGLELDAEALRNGSISVVHARGVFPDGLAFHMPESDYLPAPKAVGDLFPPTREYLVVHLAVPPRVPEGANCTVPEGEAPVGRPLNGSTRYFAEQRFLHDENTGRDEKKVHLGQKSIRIVLETEEMQALLTIPIARLMRDGTGHFVYDPSYIPPCLQIDSSPRLMMIGKRLVEILDEKAATFFRGRGSGKFRAGFSSQEIAGFWFLHTVNTSLSALRHLLMAKRGHPEELYMEMSRLGGALCTFGLDSHPRNLPGYDHLNLDQCFGVLDAHIRKHLEIVVPTNCITIPLSSTARYIFQGEVSDQRCLGRARWIVAVKCPLGELDIISRTPRLMKICSAKFLPELIKTALPGLTLSHLPVPPSAIAPKVDFQYFGINRAGNCWEHIVETRRVGVYVPSELPDAEIELLVALEE